MRMRAPPAYSAAALCLGLLSISATSLSSVGAFLLPFRRGSAPASSGRATSRIATATRLSFKRASAASTSVALVVTSTSSSSSSTALGLSSVLAPSSSAQSKYYLEQIYDKCDPSEPSDECAEALSAYLRAVSSGETQPSLAPAVALTSYLDSLQPKKGPWSLSSSSGIAVAEYLDALTSKSAAPPSPASVSAYLKGLSSGAVPRPTSARAITSHLASRSYVDDIAEECNVDEPASEECSTAIASYLDALSSGEVEAESSSTPAGKAISNYLDNPPPSGKTSSLSPPSSSSGGSGSGPAVTSYLDALSTGAVDAPSAKAVGGYLDGLSTGYIAPPSSAAAITSYLDVMDTTSTGETAPPPASSSSAPAAASASVSASASAPSSYLDAISEDCNVNRPSDECAAAVTSYLDALSSGTVQSSTEPAAAAAISSYLDGLPVNQSPSTSSGAAVASYLDALSGGSVAPPESSDAVSSYFDAVKTGEVATPKSAAAITSYLDALSATGGGTSPVPAAAASTGGGAGISSSSYLDAISGDCNALEPSNECATAITSYLDALSTGDAQPSLAPAVAITSYLDNLGGAGAAAAAPAVESEAPPPPATATAPQSPPPSSAEAVTSYMDALSSGSVEAPSSGAVSSYLDALSSGSAPLPSTAGSLSTFLDNLDTSSRVPVSQGGAGLPSYLDNMDAPPAVDYGMGGPAHEPVIPPAEVFASLAPDGYGSKTFQLEEMEDKDTSVTEIYLAPDGRVELGQSDGPQPVEYMGTWEQSADYTIHMVIKRTFSTGSESPRFTDMGEFKYEVERRYEGQPAVVGGILGFSGKIHNIDDSVGDIEVGFFEMIDTTGAKPGEVEAAVAPAAEVVEQTVFAPDPAAVGPAVEVAAAAPASSGTVPSYLDGLTTDGGGTSAGAGIGSYLDSISGECNSLKPTEECASAITGYLDALSTGAVAPSPAPAAAIASHMDEIATGAADEAPTASTEEAVTSYLDALSSGSVPPPSAGAVTSYLDSMSSGEVAAPASGGAISSYLDVLSAGTTAPSSGAGVASYADALGSPGGSAPAEPAAPASTETVTEPPPTEAVAAPSSSASAPGGSYLDAISRECDTDEPSSRQECASSITSYLDALSAGATQPTPESAGAITNYLDGLAVNKAPASSSGAAVTSYLDALATGSVPPPSSAGAVESYIDSMSTGEVAAPSTAASIASNLAAGVDAGGMSERAARLQRRLKTIKRDKLMHLKRDLLYLCASYDRGFSASPQVRKRMRSIVKDLSTYNPTPDAAGGIDPGEGVVSPLAGTWQMVWTSAPEVLSMSSSPIASVSAVYEVIDPPMATNVIDLIPRAQASLPADAVPSLTRASVTTRMERTGGDEPNRIGITLEGVDVRPREVRGFRVQDSLDVALAFQIPRIPLSGFSDSADGSSAHVDVAYLDGDMLIIDQEDIGTVPGSIYVLVRVPNADLF